MENLKGKTAFITGGASGIGLALAHACCEEGMKVVIADIRQSAIDEALATFTDKSSVHALMLDVTDRKAFEKAADEAEAKFGNIHLLVNNAGIGCARGGLWEVSYAQTDVALDINLTAVLTGLQIFIPRMLKHGEGGHVVSTASKAALIAVPGCGLYNLTKQALISMTETLVSDLQGTTVGASVFCPGPFKSSLGQTSGEIEKIFLENEPGYKEPEAPKPRPGFDMSAFERNTRPAQEAAVRILRGVKRNDLYIFTHSEFKKGFEDRVNAMLRAFPDEKPNEEFCNAFGFLVSNPAITQQTQVPALDN